MSRPKLPKEELKIKVSITISKIVNSELEKITNNKSKFIEDLLFEFIKNNK